MVKRNDSVIAIIKQNGCIEAATILTDHLKDRVPVQIVHKLTMFPIYKKVVQNHVSAKNLDITPIPEATASLAITNSKTRENAKHLNDTILTMNLLNMILYPVEVGRVTKGMKEMWRGVLTITKGTSLRRFELL